MTKGLLLCSTYFEDDSVCYVLKSGINLYSLHTPTSQRKTLGTRQIALRQRSCLRPGGNTRPTPTLIAKFYSGIMVPFRIAQGRARVRQRVAVEDRRIYEYTSWWIVDEAAVV